jgi:hypothetical protein
VGSLRSRDDNQAYYYEHTSTEHWTNGRLVALSSVTDENGTRHKVDVVTKGSGLQVQADGKAVQIDKSTILTSLWNPTIIRQSMALNSVDGKMMPITVTDNGFEEVTAQGHLIKARHYTINGRFKQDVWYDEQDGLFTRSAAPQMARLSTTSLFLRGLRLRLCGRISLTTSALHRQKF